MAPERPGPQRDHAPSATSNPPTLESATTLERDPGASRRCGNVETTSTPRWELEGARVVRRVQRRDAYVERLAGRAHQSANPGSSRSPKRQP